MNYYYSSKDSKKSKSSVKGAAMDHSGHHSAHQAIESPQEYMKLAGVFGGILVGALLLAWFRGFDLHIFMSSFMAVFFVVFGAFKLADIENFALTYRGYDIIAKRFKIWGWIYPILQIILGLAYMLLGGELRLNLITMLVSGIAGYGVYLELSRKTKLHCACLGSFIKLPLSKVSLAEDVSMFIMALLMIIL